MQYVNQVNLVLSLTGDLNALRIILLYHFSNGIFINGGLEGGVTNLLKTFQGSNLQVLSVRTISHYLSLYACPQNQRDRTDSLKLSTFFTVIEQSNRDKPTVGNTYSFSAPTDASAHEIRPIKNVVFRGKCATMITPHKLVGWKLDFNSCLLLIEKRHSVKNIETCQS